MFRRQAARETLENRWNLTGAVGGAGAPRRSSADAGNTLASILPETVHLFFPLR